MHAIDQQVLGSVGEPAQGWARIGSSALESAPGAALTHAVDAVTIQATDQAGVDKLTADAGVETHRIEAGTLGGRSRTRWHADHLLPGAEALAHDLAVAVSRQTVAARAKLVADSAERFQERLRMLGRREALKDSLTFAHRHMRVLGSVVQPLVAPVLGRRQHPLDGGVRRRNVGRVQAARS